MENPRRYYYIIQDIMRENKFKNILCLEKHLKQIYNYNITRYYYTCI